MQTFQTPPIFHVLSMAAMTRSRNSAARALDTAAAVRTCSAAFVVEPASAGAGKRARRRSWWCRLLSRGGLEVAGGTRAGARAGQQLRPQRERARHRKGGHAARWPCAGGTLGAQAAADGVLWNLVAFPDLLLAFCDEGTLPLLLNASSCCRKVLHDGEARLHQARRKYGTVYIWSQSRKRSLTNAQALPPPRLPQRLPR